MRLDRYHVGPALQLSAVGMDQGDDKKIVTVCGGSQVLRRVVCSFDSKYLLAACGEKVTVYTVGTGKAVEELLYHTNDVTGIVLDNTHPSQAFTSSLDGKIALWNFSDGSLLKSISVNGPILRLCSCPNGAQFCLSMRNSTADDDKVAVYSISSKVFTESCSSNDTQQMFDVDKPLVTLGRKSNELAFTFDGNYLVSSDSKDLVLYNVTDHTSSRIPAKAVICSLSCHPSKLCVATGTISGEIFLWYNINLLNEVVTTRLHWHAHAVSDVCFSTDGTFLLSGGEEAVLVLWQLANEQKHFRPRLAAPIKYVACCPGDQTFAVSLKNNAIELISGINNEISHTLVQLYRYLPGLGEGGDVDGCGPPLTGLVHNPRTHSIVLSGCPGHLQFFNPESLTVKSQLEVVRLNFISRCNEKPLIPTVISHVAFGSSGTWMGTIEEWSDELVTSERKLKFWKFDAEKQAYVQSTCVDPPHYDAVTGLSFRPSSESQHQVAVTTAVDGSFKVWTCCTTSNARDVWSCRSEGKYYSLPCLGCAFSEDGSLLALNYEKYITLWEPVTCKHRHTFNSPVPGDHFKEVTFGYCSASHLLVASSVNFLHIWNLLTCESILTVSIAIQVLVADPYSDRLAVFTSSELFMFSHTDSELSLVQSDIPSASCAVFLPPTTSVSSAQLYFMDNDQVLFTLKDTDKIPPKEVEENEDTIADETYREIFGEGVKERLFSDQEKVPTAGRHRLKALEMLQGPPHLLPPLSSVCTDFLRALIVEKAGEIEKINPECDSDNENKEESSADARKRDIESSDEEDSIISIKKQHTSPMEVDQDAVDTVATKRKPFNQDVDYDWLIDFFSKKV